ncbi:MAG: elongation factor G [Clostridia bacterium]|nr:elongation factor G [Clostridia bacterium]
MATTAKDIRNVAVVGHSGDGKTSLCEAMLYNAGAIDRIGKTADGTTVCDYDDIEKQRQMSIYATIANLTWKGVKINLLDTPGFYDFEGERNSALSAAEAAVVVIDAIGDVPADTEAIIEDCLKAKKPVVVFINGMDKDNANYVGTTNALMEKFPTNAAPVQEPIMNGNKMEGYVSIMEDKAYKFAQKGVEETEIPANLKATTDDLLAKLTENAAENDEELMEKFFEEGALSSEEIVKGVRLGIHSCSTMIIMAGSALQNKGVDTLLDYIVQFVPSAAERTVSATDLASGNPVEIKCEDGDAFVGQIFKTAYDQFSGKLNYIKVYRGTLKPGAVLNTTTGKEERIGQILVLRGKKSEIVGELCAGDIGAVNKLASTNTNDTLCAGTLNVKVDPIAFPQPNISMAVTAANKNDEDKMFAAFRKVMEEDYTFLVEKNDETSEMVISGQGEVQLDLISKKIKLNNKIDVVMADPKVAYRETIRKTAEGDGSYKKQSGGHGQYGVVKIRFEPIEDVFEFGEEVVGGVVPKQYFPAVEKGLRECMPKGVLAGYPVTGVRAVLFDGKYHPVDSSEMAFKQAAYLAFKDGIPKAGPVLLEPIVQLDIDIPSDFLGAVMGDISKRRGRILGNETQGKTTRVTAECPQSEVLKYATDLRSFTQGRGKFVSTFVRYEEVAPQLADKIIKDRAAQEKE